MKRGPKAYEDWTARRRATPFPAIAKALGVSLRTVFNDYRSALHKIRGTPGMHELILECVQAVDGELLEAGSAECDRDFINKFGGTQ